MAVSANDVKKIALNGEFNSLSNSEIKFYLDLATKKHKESVWGECTEEAIKLFTAHMLTLAKRGGTSGSVSSVKVGDLSKNFSNAQSDDNELGTTSYGQMYLTLRKGLVITPRLACQP